MRAMGEGHFAALPAPSGRGESIDAPHVIAPRSFDSVSSVNPLPMIGRVRRVAEKACERRAVMQAARVAETARRAGAKRTTSSGLHPADRQRLRMMDGRATPVEALEALHATYVKRVRMIARLMTIDPSLDGRGTYESPRTSWEAVNGTEVRAAEPWRMTSPALRLDRVRPLSRRSYDGGLTWEPMRVEALIERAETSTTSAVDHGGTYAARVATLGAVGNGESD